MLSCGFYMFTHLFFFQSITHTRCLLRPSLLGEEGEGEQRGQGWSKLQVDDHQLCDGLHLSISSHRSGPRVHRHPSVLPAGSLPSLRRYRATHGPPSSLRSLLLSLSSHYCHRYAWKRCLKSQRGAYEDTQYQYVCVCVCVLLCRTTSVASSFFACGDLLSDKVRYFYCSCPDSRKLW